MADSRFIARLSLEVWRAAGARTVERLTALVDQFSATYVLGDDDRRSARELALSSVRDWEISR